MTLLFTLWSILQVLIFVVWNVVKAIFCAVTPTSWHRKKQLRGKTLLITGAGGGIGGELSRQLAAKGNRLILWDYNADALATVADDCRQLGAVEVNTQVVDLSIRERIYEAAGEALRVGGGIDVVVHSAGLVNYGYVFDTADADIQRVVDVNLTALIWLSKAFVPAMIERGVGHLVALSSMASVIALPKLTDYSATKFGVNGFMEGLYTELFVRGFNSTRFTVVCPMLTRTSFIRDVIIDEKRNVVLEVDYVARQIIDAIECERQQIVLPYACNLFIALKGQVTVVSLGVCA